MAQRGREKIGGAGWNRPKSRSGRRAPAQSAAGPPAAPHAAGATVGPGRAARPRQNTARPPTGRRRPPQGRPGALSTAVSPHAPPGAAAQEAPGSAHREARRRAGCCPQAVQRAAALRCPARCPFEHSPAPRPPGRPGTRRCPRARPERPQAQRGTRGEGRARSDPDQEPAARRLRRRAAMQRPVGRRRPCQRARCPRGRTAAPSRTGLLRPRRGCQTRAAPCPTRCRAPAARSAHCALHALGARARRCCPPATPPPPGCPHAPLRARPGPMADQACQQHRARRLPRHGRPMRAPPPRPGQARPPLRRCPRPLARPRSAPCRAPLERAPSRPLACGPAPARLPRRLRRPWEQPWRRAARRAARRRAAGLQAPTPWGPAAPHAPPPAERLRRVASRARPRQSAGGAAASPEHGVERRPLSARVCGPCRPVAGHQGRP